MRRMVLVAFGLVVVFGLTGCAVYDSLRAGGRRSTADGIEAAFPAIERLAVKVFIAAERCDYIVYARGAFETAPGSDACVFDANGPRDRLVLDATAEADIDAIRAASDVMNDLDFASVEYDRSGHVRWGEFSLGDCSSFIYAPGYGRLPDADSFYPVAIDEDWYELACSPLGP